MHLDLITPDFEAETERLLALSAATAHQVEQDGARRTTFLDPERNEFDLVAGQALTPTTHTMSGSASAMTQHDHETAAEQYIPSSSQHARDQMALYEATGGREGGTLEGCPLSSSP